MNTYLYALVSNPFIVPLIIVLVINTVVLALTYLLFKKLKSEAIIKEGKWAAGGALAGFIIITSMEVYLINHFAPNSLEQIPSYQVTKQFYDHIQFRRYDQAWALIDPEYQMERWKGKEDDFIRGYTNTVKIKLLAIMLNNQQSPASHDYTVYYVDDVNSPRMPGLENLTALKLRDWPKVTQALIDNRELLAKNGLDTTAFDDVTLLQLLAPDRGNKIVWSVDTKGKPSATGIKAADLYNEKLEVEYITGRSVTVQATRNGWLISQIKTIVVKDE
jgi:hypothetical protein